MSQNRSSNKALIYTYLLLLVSFSVRFATVYSSFLFEYLRDEAYAESMEAS